VNEKLPSWEQALNLLIENGCSNDVIIHCKRVAELAVETAEAIKKKGLTVDSKLVEVGALLHDIGRSKTHSVNHVIEGAKIANGAGLPKPVVSIIKRHVGGGITKTEAQTLGWPVDDTYFPITLEEKVVSFADKLIEKGKRVPVKLTIEKLLREGRPEAAERVRRLHEEMVGLTGGSK